MIYLKTIVCTANIFYMYNIHVQKKWFHYSIAYFIILPILYFQADMKPSVSSSSVGGLPSSFVLPISSPERQSHKHIKLRKHTSVTTTTTVSSISSSVRGGGGVSISSTSSTAGEGRSSLGHMTNGDKSTAVNSNDTNIDLMKTST